MRRENNLRIKSLIAAVILVVFAGCVDQLQEIGQQEDVLKPYTEEILEISENTIETEKISLDFTTCNGFMEIHLWEKESYRIEVNKWAKGETPEEAKALAVNGGIKGFFQGDDIDISVVNGDIVIQADSVGTFDISTVNGDIDMTVGSDFTFDLEISHGKISVRADGVTYTLDTKTHKKGSTAEDTNVSVKASTVNGSIAVAKT